MTSLASIRIRLKNLEEQLKTAIALKEQVEKLKRDLEKEMKTISKKN